MYNFILKNINTFLRFYYYDYYFKNEDLIKNFKSVLFKFEYFLYLRFYFMYLFFYYYKKNNLIYYSFLLNFQHIIGEICITNLNHYKIVSKYNIEFLNKVTIYFFDYLLLNNIYFSRNIKFSNKFFIIFNVMFFQLGIIINKLFEKRIKCIKNKQDLNDSFNFLFLLPGLENVIKVVEKTKFMNYKNFYIYLNIILWIFS